MIKALHLAALWCWDDTVVYLYAMQAIKKKKRERRVRSSWDIVAVRRQVEERGRNRRTHNVLSDFISRSKIHWWMDKLLNDDDMLTWTTYSGKTADPRWESSSSSMVKPLQLTWSHKGGEKKQERGGGKTQINRWRKRPAGWVIW